MKQIKITVLLLILIIFGCEKKKSSLNFEQKVFSQIEKQIIDSTFKDERLNFLLANKNKFSQEKRQLRKDTLRLSVTINDFFFPFNKTDKAELDKFFYNSEFKIDPEYIHFNKTSYIDEFSDIKIPNKYQKYSKTLNKLSCSKIEFDYQKANGALCVISYYGKNNKLGYIIFISKKNNQWKVIRVMPTWIS